MTAADAAIKFIGSLKLPEGPHAGERIKLAEFQKRFIRGALGEGVSIAALSVGRGSGKTMLGAALCLGALLGKLGDRQPRREIVVAAKVRDQGMVAFRYIEGLAASLPIKTRKQLTFVKAPRLEVRYSGDGDGHSIRVLASDARNALGLSPVFALLDERGFWLPEGDRLEEAILTALGKRQGRCISISTSAPTDAHAFSRLLDDPGEGAFVQEHRAPDGCEPDDLEALKAANPGSVEGIGPSLAWLQAQGRRAAARGGNALASHRLFVLNQRTSDEARSVLITTDQWQRCEVDELPPREGPLAVGIDLGGSASMTAWAAFWPTTGRLEAYAAFPSVPGLLERGRADAVADRYVLMQKRGELMCMGANVVAVDQFIAAMSEKLDGYTISAIVCDRFRQAEFIEALSKSGIRIAPTFRGFGWRDGSEDVSRARAFVADGKVKVLPSLLLRSSFADAITLLDAANNAKIAKGRSTGRIDAACAAVLAIAEGSRITGRAARKTRAPVWA